MTNNNDRTRFSVVGDFLSDDMRVTERWEIVDADTIRHSATIEDPKVYARPWTVSNAMKRHKEPGYEIMEYAGVEDEKDVRVMLEPPSPVQK